MNSHSGAILCYQDELAVSKWVDAIVQAMRDGEIDHEAGADHELLHTWHVLNDDLKEYAFGYLLGHLFAEML